MTQDSINFDYVADDYDQTRGIPSSEIAPIVQAFQEIGNIQPNTKILEIGIGTGQIALPLAQHSQATIFGVDISVKMLEQLCKKQTDENIYLAIADGLNLPFADNTFDIIVTSHIFHVIPNTQQLLNEIQRVLNANGQLLYSYGVRGGKELIWSLIEDTLHDLGKPSITLTKWKQSNILESYGWDEPLSHMVHHYTEYYNPTDLLEQVQKRMWSLVVNLSDDELATVIHIVKEKLLMIENRKQLNGVAKCTYSISSYRPNKSNEKL